MHILILDLRYSDVTDAGLGDLTGREELKILVAVSRRWIWIIKHSLSY